jgi:hypothetical protein
MQVGHAGVLVLSQWRGGRGACRPFFFRVDFGAELKIPIQADCFRTPRQNKIPPPHPRTTCPASSAPQRDPSLTTAHLHFFLSQWRGGRSACRLFFLGVDFGAELKIPIRADCFRTPPKTKNTPAHPVDPPRVLRASARSLPNHSPLAFFSLAVARRAQCLSSVFFGVDFGAELKIPIRADCFRTPPDYFRTPP